MKKTLDKSAAIDTLFQAHLLEANKIKQVALEYLAANFEALGLEKASALFYLDKEILVDIICAKAEHDKK